MASSGLEQARLHRRHVSSCFRTSVLPVSAGCPWSWCCTMAGDPHYRWLPAQSLYQQRLTHYCRHNSLQNWFNSVVDVVTCLLSSVLSASLPPSPSSSQSFTDTLFDYCVDILFDNMHINTDFCVDIRLSLVYCWFFNLFFLLSYVFACIGLCLAVHTHGCLVRPLDHYIILPALLPATSIVCHCMTLHCIDFFSTPVSYTHLTLPTIYSV